MATKLTPQQIAAAAAKRAATQAANRANGIPTVRQARAAAKAAKLGQPFVPPAPRAPRAPRNSRRRRSSYYSQPTAAPSTPRGPMFAPRPSYRALKLVALAALEAVHTQRVIENGKTPDMDVAFEKYKKVKTLALSVASSKEAQNEADAALLHATVHLLKLAF